jgi:hypothetical protein
MLNTWIIRNFNRVQLGASALEEEAVVAVEEWILQDEKKNQEKDGESTTLREKRNGDTPLG